MIGATTMGYRTWQCPHCERKTNDKCNNHGLPNSTHTETINHADMTIIGIGYPAQQRDTTETTQQGKSITYPYHTNLGEPAALTEEG